MAKLLLTPAIVQSNERISSRCSQSDAGGVLGPALAVAPLRVKVTAVIRWLNQPKEAEETRCKGKYRKNQANSQHVSVQQTHPGQSGRQWETRRHEVRVLFPSRRS